jgi:peptidyl-prolyl cis-trans isomerase SurA
MKNGNRRTILRVACATALMGLVFVFYSIPNFSFAQQVLDRIIAVVGDQIILESELNTQVEMYVAQMQISLKTQKERDKLKKQLLEQMLNDKLLLIASEKDTLIQVTDKEVDEALQKQMNKIKSEFTDEEFEAQLEAEGLTEIELKKKYREQIKNQLMIDRLVASKLQKVSVSTKEVRDFFEIYQDSIPDQPEAVKLSHLLLEIKTSQGTLDSLKSKSERVLEFAKSGKDFAQLASLYSDDPTSQQGGDLGFFRRGDMIPKFEEMAFSLQTGEISDVIQTEFGYHIIKVEEKQGDRVHARHILFLIRPSKQDSMRTQQLADSLYNQLLGGADFGEVAKQFSVDEESRKMGGELGWYPVEQMTPEFKQGIQELQMGEISSPLKSPAGIHILKVLDRREQRKLSLEEDWDTIKDMVRRKKTNQLVLQWVEKLRQDIYVEIRE